MLESSHSPLLVEHDVVMLDLDGVVYAEGSVIPDAPTSIAALRDAAVRVAFITNNASRTPRTVARILSGLGVPAEPEDVVTSAQAASSLLVERFGVGAAVLYLGAEGLQEALAGAGLVPVADPDAPEVVAVTTGYGPEVPWYAVMQTAVRIRDGLPWVACNTDWTIPLAAGPAPGHGVMVKMLSDFSGVIPDVAGKPAPPLLHETVSRTGADRPLMVGDRLDTDIKGATALGMRSLLVLTGVTDLRVLAAARPAERPSYISPTLRGLHVKHPAPRREQGEWHVGGWSARVAEGRLVLRGREERPEPADWWRAAACAAWEHLDATGTAVELWGLEPPEPAPR